MAACRDLLSLLEEAWLSELVRFTPDAVSNYQQNKLDRHIEFGAKAKQKLKFWLNLQSAKGLCKYFFSKAKARSFQRNYSLGKIWATRTFVSFILVLR